MVVKVAPPGIVTAPLRQPVDLPPMYTLNPTSTDKWDQIAFVGQLPGETNVLAAFVGRASPR